MSINYGSIHPDPIEPQQRPQEPKEVATVESIEQQLAAIRLQREALQLELESEQVAQLRSKKEERLRQQQVQADSLEQSKREIERQQGYCNHRKGGKILGRGDSTQYAVIQHTFADGSIHIRCTRCLKNWTPTDRDYETALAFPTDNEPSVAALFRIPAKA